MRKKDHGKSEDDKWLWETVTSQINPLRSVRYSGGIKKPPINRKNSPPRKMTGGTVSSEIGTSLSLSAKALPIDLREGDHAGLDKTTRRKLSRGDLPVEARLDLHGYNAAQAEIRLRAFIQSSASFGHRCVLVITGKGVRGEGVLRRHVPVWLKQPPLGNVVLALSNATPRDGGSGAIYVLLRRARPSK